MTPQMEANELLKIWQRNRHKPPERRLDTAESEYAPVTERPVESHEGLETTPNV